MINYIIADLHRIAHKKSFLYTFLAYIGLFLAMVFVLYNPSFSSNEYISKSQTFLEFYSIIIGISVFLCVYYDDFKSKSMQIAIGHGLSRYKVVLVKSIEVIIISIIIGIIIGIVMLITPFILKMNITNIQATGILVVIGMNVLKIIGYISISTILVYYSQNAVMGIIFYLLLVSNTVFLVFKLILGQEFIVKLIGDLTEYLYSPLLHYISGAIIQNGSLSFGKIFGIFAYIMVPAVISIELFRKKELEF